MLHHIHNLLAVSLFQRLHRMGGPGLILLGIADNSVVPLTGSVDVLTIWLAAHHREPWPYYAFMATIGAVLGGYITYGLARKGGKETLERKLSKRTAASVHKGFERWGFYAVAVPAVLPPPFPIVPFLLAAGALEYPSKKFLAALTLGRAVRYTILASLGARYGGRIVTFFAHNYKPTLAILIGLAVLGAVTSLISYYRHRPAKNAPGASQHPRVA